MNRQIFGLSTLALLALLVLVTPSSFALNIRSSPCLVQTDKIICSGPLVTDTSLLMLKDELHTRYHGMFFLELHLSDTSISMIPSGVFSEVEFENIYIQDNKYLTHIAEDAFMKHKTKTLMIMNNPLLKSNAVYRLADRLEVTDYVDFDFNALVEVPSHAFNEHLQSSATFFDSSHKAHPVPGGPHHASPLSIVPNLSKKVTFRKLVISNNKIQRVNENAFHLLESCKQIYLNYNQINHIAKHGFNLADHGTHSSVLSDQQLQISLDHNKLTKDSFEPEFIELNDKTQLLLNLSFNEITGLRMNIFKPLLEKKNIFIDLSSNPLDCHSEDVTWLMHDPKVFVKTKGINC